MRYKSIYIAFYTIIGYNCGDFIGLLIIFGYLPIPCLNSLKELGGAQLMPARYSLLDVHNHVATRLTDNRPLTIIIKTFKLKVNQSFSLIFVFSTSG